MNWTLLTNKNQIERIIKESEEKPIVIFQYPFESKEDEVLKFLKSSFPFDSKEVLFFYYHIPGYEKMIDIVRKYFKVPDSKTWALIIRNNKSIFMNSGIDTSVDEITKVIKNSQQKTAFIYEMADQVCLYLKEGDYRHLSTCIVNVTDHGCEDELAALEFDDEVTTEVFRKAIMNGAHLIKCGYI